MPEKMPRTKGEIANEVAELNSAIMDLFKSIEAHPITAVMAMASAMGQVMAFLRASEMIPERDIQGMMIELHTMFDGVSQSLSKADVAARLEEAKTAAGLGTIY